MTAPRSVEKSASPLPYIGHTLFGLLSNESRADFLLRKYLSEGDVDHMGPMAIKELHRPGTVSGIHNVISTGKYAPELFRKEMGNGPISKVMSKALNNRIGGKIVADAAVERLLPSIGGSKDLARTCLQAGGVI